MDAPDKCVALRYINGFLKYFVDNWDLYKIGSTSVNLSEKEAMDIAMARAKNYSWNSAIKFNVTNAMIWENIFAGSLYMDTARSQDPLELFPMRHVWVSLDKFYPGNVYGMNVYVWADTGKIGYIHERFSTMDPPADLMATDDDTATRASNQTSALDKAQSNSLSPTWIVLPAFAAVTLGTASVCLTKKKNSRLLACENCAFSSSAECCSAFWYCQQC